MITAPRSSPGPAPPSPKTIYFLTGRGGRGTLWGDLRQGKRERGKGPSLNHIILFVAPRFFFSRACDIDGTMFSLSLVGKAMLYSPPPDNKIPVSTRICFHPLYPNWASYPL